MIPLLLGKRTDIIRIVVSIVLIIIAYLIGSWDSFITFPKHIIERRHPNRFSHFPNVQLYSSLVEVENPNVKTYKKKILLKDLFDNSGKVKSREEMTLSNIISEYKPNSNFIYVYE